MSVSDTDINTDTLCRCCRENEQFCKGLRRENEQFYEETSKGRKLEKQVIEISGYR